MRAAVLICFLLALPSALCGHALSRFFPVEPAPVPALWWAIDTSAPLPIAALQQWFVDSAAGQPAASLRPLPSDGVGIGLLAGVPDAQGVLAVQEIMAPWPLNATRAWPAERRHRRINMTQASATIADLSLTLPLPGETVSAVDAELLLPRVGPPNGPYRIDVTVETNRTILSTETLFASDRDSFITLPLSALLSPWPLFEALQATFRLSARADTPWTVAAISPSNPAIWQLSWQSPSVSLSGRGQWQRVLNSLLVSADARTDSMPDLAVRLQSQIQGQAVPKETAVNYRPAQLPEACGGVAGLLLAADTLLEDIPSQLTHWLDTILQGPLQPYRQLPRVRNGLLSGTDVHYTKPTLGRAIWPGDHGFRACQSPSECDDISSLMPTLQARASSDPVQGVVFSDAVLGPQGQLTAVNQPGGAIKHVMLGDSLLIDTGPDPSRVTGRAEFLLWLGVDGTLWLRDGDSGDLMWRWQPTIWQAHRARLSSQPAASRPEHLSPSALQLWSGEQGQRIVYIVLAGQLLAIDLHQPAQPRLLPWTLPSVVVDSLSIMPKALNAAASVNTPELLVGVSQAPSEPVSKSTHLLRVNGINGEILWRAEAEKDLPQWPMPWTFISWQQSLRAYGVDSRGRTWRLQASASDGAFAMPIVIAQLSESRTELEVLTSPDVSIQPDANGRRRVALSFATSASEQAGVMVFAWLDDERDTALTLSTLPLWTSSSEPPSHDIGWRRQFSLNQDIGLSPRWLDDRLLLTLETVLAAKAQCLAAEVNTRLYDMPWRKGRITALANEMDLGASPTQLATPVLTEEGKLYWLGQSRPNSGLGVNAYRRRLQRTPLID